MGWLFKGFNSLPRDFGAKNNQDGIETNLEHPSRHSKAGKSPNYLTVLVGCL